MPVVVHLPLCPLFHAAIAGPTTEEELPVRGRRPMTAGRDVNQLWIRRPFPQWIFFFFRKIESERRALGSGSLMNSAIIVRIAEIDRILLDVRGDLWPPYLLVFDE